MTTLLVGDRGCRLVPAGRCALADGQVAWMYEDGEGRPLMTQVGVEVDFVRLLNEAPSGLVFEFGVAAGESIRKLALSNRKIYGFDWWKGLPHDWNVADLKGSCLARKPDDLPENVTLIEGLFSDTLEPFLLAHPGVVGFVHIDCDLYCSTLYVLKALRERFVRGSVIAFDEMDLGHYGEWDAWQRYLHETKQKWEFVGKQHAWGQVYRML